MAAPPAYPMVDRAYYDPRIFDVAREVGARAINIYAWDHYLSDVNGFCGGWTPAVVAQIYAAGYDCHFVFCFRDGDAPVDPATCVSILKTLGAGPGAIVHNDIESGAMDNLAHDLAFTQAVQAAGFRSAPYGLASTLRMGYLEGAYSAWVASYVAPWDSPPPLANVPNVGAYDEIGWQFSSTSPPGLDVDVSTVNYTIGGGNAPPGVNTRMFSDDDIANAIGRELYEICRDDEPDGGGLQNFINDAKAEGLGAAVTKFFDTMPEFQDEQRRHRALLAVADNLVTLAQSPPKAGPAGPPGPAPTDTQIADAVAAYLKANPPALGGNVTLSTSPTFDTSWGALLAELLRRILGKS